jgi:hypothetical protein
MRRIITTENRIQCKKNCIYYKSIIGYKTKEELVMTKKNKESQQSLNGVDFFWDGWLNSIKTVQGIQEDLEGKSLQAFGYQKELLDSTRESLSNLEKGSKQLTQDWKERFAEQDQFQPIFNWMKTIEEVTSKTQNSPWNPGYALMDFISKSQEQFEETGKYTVKQQQKARTDVLKTIETVSEQMKQKQKELLVTV